MEGTFDLLLWVLLMVTRQGAKAKGAPNDQTDTKKKVLVCGRVRAVARCAVLAKRELRSAARSKNKERL